MKKHPVLTLIFVFAFALVFTACGGVEEAPDDNGQTEAADTVLVAEEETTAEFNYETQDGETGTLEEGESQEFPLGSTVTITEDITPEFDLSGVEIQIVWEYGDDGIITGTATITDTDGIRTLVIDEEMQKHVATVMGFNIDSSSVVTDETTYPASVIGLISAADKDQELIVGDHVKYVFYTNGSWMKFQTDDTPQENVAESFLFEADLWGQQLHLDYLYYCASTYGQAEFTSCLARVLNGDEEVITPEVIHVESGPGGNSEVTVTISETVTVTTTGFLTPTNPVTTITCTDVPAGTAQVNVYGGTIDVITNPLDGFNVTAGSHDVEPNAMGEKFPLDGLDPHFNENGCWVTVFQKPTGKADINFEVSVNNKLVYDEDIWLK